VSGGARLALLGMLLVAAWPAAPAHARQAQVVAPVAADGNAAGGVGTALATLAPLTDAGVSGEASALQAGPSTTLVVRLSGLAPGAAYAGSVRGGGCDGPPLFPLGTIVADGGGRGSASAVVPAPLAPAAWWIRYDADESPSGSGLACGLLLGNGGGAQPAEPTERCPIRGAAPAALCQ
jgi:hypothetical protein